MELEHNLDSTISTNSFQFFDDGICPIDFVLVSKKDKFDYRQNQRELFEDTLVKNGLRLEEVNGYGVVRLCIFSFLSYVTFYL